MGEGIQLLIGLSELLIARSQTPVDDLQAINGPLQLLARPGKADVGPNPCLHLLRLKGLGDVVLPSPGERLNLVVRIR